MHEFHLVWAVGSGELGFEREAGRAEDVAEEDVRAGCVALPDQGGADTEGAL